MNESLIVLPSARAIRQRQLEVEEQTLFLPNFITMSDFIIKLCLVQGERYIDDDTRTLLLLEASNFENFSNLQIERNFFTFTKNSSYIFKFFEELSTELYEIENLKEADVYAEYDEHITILQELYKRYESLCSEKKLLDRIFLPKRYTFNEEYVKKYEKIEIVLEGYLTNFELQLLKQATEFARVEIEFKTSRFNIKMQKKFIDLGFDLSIGKRYKLLLNSNEILTQELLEYTPKISCVSFSESLLQIAFIKQKIYEYIKKGFDPEKIAVVLPNEQSSKSIRAFDDKSNLNFAMGDSFKESSIYKKLNATIMLLDTATYENIYRVEREGDVLYSLLIPDYKKSIEEVDFVALLEKIQEQIESKQDKKIFMEELHSFKVILPYLIDMNVRLALNLFMQRLASRTIDDVRGGKVTVMGVLETRNIVFDAVIIIDFDEKSVPKRSDKDMFLNTKLREIAGLPTMRDRENLQKHYYESLMQNAKELAISFVSSNENQASRFLKELGIEVQSSENELEYAKILFHRNKRASFKIEEIIEPYSFKDIKLSNTRLKTYLTCKRKYYYSYVKNIKDHEIPRDMPQEYAIGEAVHHALESLYKHRDVFYEKRELQAALEKELDFVQGESELEAYLIALKKRELLSFYDNEIKRFKDGWRVKYCEESFSAPFEGMILQGKIDRIDKKDNLLSVLDYKTGAYTLYNKNNFTDATDFQLEFYYILASSLGNVDECGFYDLKEAKVVQEPFLEEKLALLKGHIADLLAIEEINFTLCEDIKACQYCPYKLMCGRE